LIYFWAKDACLLNTLNKNLGALPELCCEWIISEPFKDDNTEPTYDGLDRWELDVKNVSSSQILNENWNGDIHMEAQSHRCPPFSASCSPALSLSLSLSHAVAHTHTLTYTYTHTHSLYLTQTLYFLSLSLSLSLTQTLYFLSLSLSHSFSFFSLPQSNSLTPLCVSLRQGVSNFHRIRNVLKFFVLMFFFFLSKEIWSRERKSF